MKWRYLIYVLAVVLYSCKDDPKEPERHPEKAVLYFPEANAVCNTGRIISATESEVTLKWLPSEFTTDYEVTIEDLEAKTSVRYSTQQPEKLVILKLNTPYSWYVTSIGLTGDPAVSDKSRFYNSGPGATSFAPFPAEIVYPIMGQQVNGVNRRIKLEWKGADADNNITGYDLYFGSGTPKLVLSDIGVLAVDTISVSSGNTYFWKVVTKDGDGNASDSGVYQFKVK